MTADLIIGDVRDALDLLPESSVDFVLTSSPFFSLRSYLPSDHKSKFQEIGTEATPGAFIDTLLDVTEKLARVLAPHGSLAWELGDTYARSGGVGGDVGALPKSLCLIPESYRWSLVYGRNPFNGRETPRWRVRNNVRWFRPNPPVGALGDKFRLATSDMVIACKSGQRWFDLDAVRHTHIDPRPDGRSVTATVAGKPRQKVAISANPVGAPPLDTWIISTQPYSGSHYATWPEELCVKPILSMCPERVCRECGEPSRRAMVGWTDCGHDSWRPGVVLDPFAGSGTTLQVATRLGRDAIGIDLDERNHTLIHTRVGMFMGKITNLLTTEQKSATIGS